MFGDVSNTVAIVKPSKDDSALNSKHILQPTIKPVPALYERKSTSLLRPAQRPLSVSGLKTYFTGGSSTASSENSAGLPLDTNGVPTQAVNVKKAPTKRHTTIFKESRLDAVHEAEITNSGPDNDHTLVKEKEAKSRKLDVETRPFFLPPASHITAEPVKEAQDPQSEISLPGIDEVSLGPTLFSDLNNEVNVKETITAVSDSSSHPALLQHHLENALSNLPPQPSDASAPATTHADVHQIPVAKLVNPVDAIPPLNPHHTSIQGQVEQEEYWDEEDDDNYEEEGYVTARSFRSKGDNTTGGATAVLFPQVNQRVRKEISAAKQLVEVTRSPEEVEDENFDTSMVAEYGEEIFDYMKQLELKMLPNAHYMENQHEIQWSMRSVLMDWLVQVHLRFNLLPETLFLTVNYIDRFLSCKVVSLGKLQLVGATAIFIAAKYEEINCPSVQEIVYMVDGGYSVDEILKAERFMLTMLQFELGWPGPMSFLRRISKADDYDLETRTLAKYFLEITLMDERFIGSPPSFTAAASHCIARIMLRKGTWVCQSLDGYDTVANQL